MQSAWGTKNDCQMSSPFVITDRPKRESFSEFFINRELSNLDIFTAEANGEHHFLKLSSFLFFANVGI